MRSFSSSTALSILFTSSVVIAGGTATFNLADGVSMLVEETYHPYTGNASIPVPPPPGFVVPRGFMLEIPNVNDYQQFECYIDGDLQEGEAVFSIGEGPDFLKPCGPNNGLTVHCDVVQSLC